ncbi:hypothetical protein K474DRAFT_880491 [Panus rudis PR-1116 ss-1]|nr:hypothetical protein K474DRAFT_880491 [Panus rudis PR-1116 ss-1]
MSDPPKKPGSLKDRIAAFENKGPAPPPPAPGPRPKPTGGVSWKPRPPSPPSSPPRTSEDGERKAAGMSAADAKESITKGGSLKERMAALQGRGGFGGLPGAAPAGPPPRPSGEKPKWKPPPKPIATPDPPEAEPSAEPKERPQSPPTGETPASEEGAPAPPAVAEAPEGDVAPAEDQEPDPEEEERQRRAAIAARMARLGGARVGFGPPVFGVKPPVKKPSVPKEEKAEGAETTTETQPKSTPDEVPAIKSPDEAKKTEDKPEGMFVFFSASLVSASYMILTFTIYSPPDYFTPTPPAGASNDSNPSLLSADTPPSAGIKSPTSMPVPSVPRRAAPPRRKTPKSPSPAPAPPPAALQEVEEAAKVAEETAVPTPALKEEDGVEDKDSEGEIKKEEEEKEQPKSEPEGQEAVPVPAPAEAEVKSKVEEDVDKAPVDSHEAKDSALDVDEPAVVPEKVEDKTTHEPEIADAPAQSHSAKEELPEEEETEETKDTKESEVAYLKDDSVDVKQPAVTDEPAALDEPTAKDHVTQLKEHDPEREESEPEEEHAVAQEEHSEKVEESAVGGGEDEDEDDEAARRKRIAERVAKMGGFNPFAGGAPPPPPVRKPSSSSEVTSPIAHASDAPRSPPVPRRKESTDSVSQQHQQQSIGRRTSVDSTNSQSYAQPLRSPPILPTSPKPSLPGRKDSVGSVQSLSQGQEHSARRASRDDDAGEY